jgi:hypothetical protein
MIPLYFLDNLHEIRFKVTRVTGDAPIPLQYIVTERLIEKGIMKMTYVSQSTFILVIGGLIVWASIVVTMLPY